MDLRGVSLRMVDTCSFEPFLGSQCDTIFFYSIFAFSYFLYRMAEPTETEKMLRGELFRAFTPDLVAARARCKYACNRFNKTDEVPRRRLVELWRE